MKAHIPIEAKIGSKDLKEIQEWAKNCAYEEYKKNNRDATRRLFQLLTVSLNQKYGFGQKRLTELFDNLGELMAIHEQDPAFWEHVSTRCKQIGINFLDKFE